MSKSICFILISLIITSVSFGQQKEAAKKLVDEGIILHDKGEYDLAIAKYDSALELDKDNLLALTEKAFSLFAVKKYDESIACCKKAIENHPGERGDPTAYVTYGNALDALKKTDQAIEIYDEGIKYFPDYFQLHFNKGIALSGVQRLDEALLCFQKSVMISPGHPGSHNAIARILERQGNRIASILAYCRFLVIEPQSGRAKENIARLQKLMRGNVEETGKNSVTVNISPDMLNDAGGKPKENSFNATDLILSMDAAMDYDKKNKKKSDVEKFIRKFETVCASLKETRKDNFGFYWDYYVPYFTELNDKKFSEAFSYVAFMSSGNPDGPPWLKGHQSDVDKFYDWSKGFQWATK